MDEQFRCARGSAVIRYGVFSGGMFPQASLNGGEYHTEMKTRSYRNYMDAVGLKMVIRREGRGCWDEHVAGRVQDRLVKTPA
jgi:hypothetical protein